MAVERGVARDGDGDALVAALPVVHLPLLEEGVAVLLHVVVYDARKLLVPNSQPVHVDVILDVLKGAPEAVQLQSQHAQLLEKLRNVELDAAAEDGGFAHKHQLRVARLCNLQNELFANAFLEQLLRIELDDPHERLVHRQNPLREHSHLVRRLRELVPLVKLRELLEEGLFELGRELLQVLRLHGDDAVEHAEHRDRNHLEHLSHVSHELGGIVLRDGVQIRGAALTDAQEREVEQRLELEEQAAQLEHAERVALDALVEELGVKFHNPPRVRRVRHNRQGRHRPFRDVERPHHVLQARPRVR
mmetsp:Transcript_24485/g.79920  ORF Transcript_24485/g.79920 Transcript_24485/m.79920 type:complete len:304 (+) Transcript_24485:1050-1961(+)